MFALLTTLVRGLQLDPLLEAGKGPKDFAGLRRLQDLAHFVLDCGIL